MSFFGKIKSRKLSKTLAAFAASGILFFGANDALAATNNNADFEFRKAYLSVPQDNRNIQQSVTFFGTTFHVDINCTGNILRDASMQMGGNIAWDYTNPSNNLTTNSTMPFYITQNNNEITFYVQRNKKWSRFLLPGVPATFANALKSNDISILTENLKAVRYVELFRDTNTQQIFNITLSGHYLAQQLETYSKNPNTSGMSAEEVESQKTFIRNLQAALQKTDIVCTWTVDKVKNQTITAVVDFTELMRNYAKNILDESAAGKVVLTDEERMLMDTIGYYSEFHYSLSYMGVGQQTAGNPPAAATRAPVNNNIFQDLIKDMTSAARR